MADKIDHARPQRLVDSGSDDSTEPVSGSRSTWRSLERDFSLSQILRGIDAPGTLCRRVSALPGVDEAQQIWQILRQYPLFQELPETEVRLRIARGDLRVEQLERDRLLNTADRVVLLLGGQLVLGWFSTAVLAAELTFQQGLGADDPRSGNREFDWRVEHGPLIQRAAANLAYFDAAETVVALNELLGPAPVEPPGKASDLVLALFAATPAKVASFSLACLALWQKEYPALWVRLARGLARSRERLQRTGGAVDTATEFFVRHGLTVAKTLRVVDLQKCTGCRDCEVACAERYGASRLRIDGPRLGPLALADCCRTCEDRRCIAVCAYDAMAYDPAAGEVRIFDSHCIGCGKCSLACPYGAIEMQDLASHPALVARVQVQAPKDAAVRPEIVPDQEVARRTRLANKCDHCQVSYGGQQACISACQKDALYELTPLDIFLRRAPNLTRPAQASLLTNSEAVGQYGLLSVPELGERRRNLAAQWPTPEPRLRIGGLWPLSLGLLGVLALVAFRSWYGPRSPQGLTLGVLATVFMAAAALYTPFSRMQRLRRDAATRLARPAPDPLPSRPPSGWRRMGRVAGAISFHTWAGTLGLLLVILHSQGRLVGRTDFGVLGFWFLVIVTFSGVVARYATAAIQRLIVKAQSKQDAQNRLPGRTDETYFQRGVQRLLRRFEHCSQLRAGTRHARALHISAAVLCILFVLLHIGRAVLLPNR